MPFTFFRKQISSADAAEICEVQAARLFANTGCIENGPYQRPRSGTNKGPVVASRRNCCDCGGRVVASRDDKLRFAKRRVCVNSADEASKQPSRWEQSQALPTRPSRVLGKSLGTRNESQRDEPSMGRIRIFAHPFAADSDR